ncbi:hypothetical protein FQA39_LY12225 [Lamprigera yunnana]|nr:hypothetical protein FQA39_LY12225 [Lamprigera yunnana]
MAAVVLLVFTFALLNSSKASLDVSLTNNQNVATCTAFLSRWMFEDQKTVVFVYDGFISGLSPNYISNPYISLDIRSPIFKTSEYSNNFVINIRDKEDLRKSIRFLRRSTIWNPKTSPGGKFLVVTTNHNVSSIFNCLWEHNIINSVVLTISSDNLTYYTSNPYHPKNKCGKSVQHFKTNKCEWEVPTELRVKTFNGCEITVLVYHFPQFFSKEPMAFLIRFLLFIFEDSLKVRTTFMHPRQSKKFFERLNITIFTRNSQTSWNSISSLTFHSEKIIFIVPVPEKMSAMQVLVSVFKFELWVIIMMVLLLMVLIWWITLKLHNKKLASYYFFNVILDVIHVTIWSSIPKVPKCKILKFIFLIYTVYCVHIQISYSSGLIRVLTVPLYEKGIRTVEDLINSDLPIYQMFNNTESLLKMDYHNELSRKLLKKIVFSEEVRRTILKNIYTDRNCSAMMSRHYYYVLLSTDFYDVRTIYNSNWTKTIDSVFSSITGHYYFSRLNDIISIIHESGIYQKKWNEFFLKFYKTVEQENNDPVD